MNKASMNTNTDLRVVTSAALLVLVLVASPALAEGEQLDYEENKFIVLVGATHEGRRENGVTLGLEYERQLSEPFGVGGVVERVFGDL